MISPNLFTKHKGLFFFVISSLILHISFFIVNPVFSFKIFEKLEDSNGRFLMVEIVDMEGKAERPESLGTQKSGSLEKPKVNGKKAEKVKTAKAAPSREAKLKTAANSEADLKEEKKPEIKPVPEAVPPVEESKEEAPTEQISDLKSDNPEQSINDPSSMEREKGAGDERTEMKEETQAVPAELPQAEESSAEREGTGEAVADLQPSVVEETITAEVKEEAAKDDIQPIISEEIKDEKGKIPEIMENGESGQTPAPETPATPLGSDKETIKDERQKETEEKILDEKRYDLKEMEKEEPLTGKSTQEVTDQSAKIKIAEKEEEPLKKIEEKDEPPAIKKKRTIPFHKMLEPEKDAIIGIPLGRPFIQITAPAKGKVASRVQSVSGRAQGKGITRVVLSVNGENTIIPLQDGRFLWDAVLRDGKNTISGTVRDMDGKSASHTVMVEVLPPKNVFGLSIDEPAGELEYPVAKVRGRVEDATVDTVKLILNGEFFETSVEDGHFERTVLFKERENALQAEAMNSRGLTVRTEPLNVLVKNPLLADILIHLVWSDTEVELHSALSWKERANLEDEKAVPREAAMVELISGVEGYGENIYSVGKAGDGAYTLKVLGRRGTDCRLVVSLNPSGKVRVFEKRLPEGEKWFVGRFLMPEGVFWDEDEWFSGSLEDSYSITKYKSPEGVTWKELK